MNFRILFLAFIISFTSCIYNSNIKIPPCSEYYKFAKEFGFFSSDLYYDYNENLEQKIEMFGNKPSYVLWYIQIQDNFPEHIVENNKNFGISTVISHDLKSDHFSLQHNRIILKEIINGKWDKYFNDFAEKAKEAKVDIYYRFGYEMNGDWFPWGQQPELFTNAWCHVWQIFDNKDAKNVKWVFSPNIIGKRIKDKIKRNIPTYYPGDKYVDIVSLDGYNWGDNYSKYHSWESFLKIFNTSISQLKNLNKPMWISEIGCPTDKRREKWISDFLDYFDNSCFDVFIWFNEDKKSEPNFKIDADSASINVLRKWVKENY